MDEAPNYDERRWPVVIITPTWQPMSNERFQVHLDRVSTYFYRGDLFGLVFNTRDAPVLPPEQRRMIVEQMERDSRVHSGLCVASALITTSAAQRGIITVMGWLSGRKLNARPFTELEEGVSWVRAEIAHTAKCSGVLRLGKGKATG